MIAAIAEQRLLRQRLTGATVRSPAEVVAWFGAVQAQEYDPAKWALALRMRDGVVDADVEGAFDDGRILRTHAMRPTWHFVTPADIHWLQQLTASRVLRTLAVYDRHLELDARTIARGLRVVERALGDRCYLTRAELAELLHRAGLPLRGSRLAHLLAHGELNRLLCSGPRRGRKFTYALLAERAPHAGELPRDEAMATLARRFLQSHGPATAQDFMWWSGLLAGDARRALDIVKARREEIGGRTYWVVGNTLRAVAKPQMAHLLPIYDEYLVAYRHRDAVPHGPSTSGVPKGFVTFRHAVVVAGQVAGTWLIERRARDVQVVVTPLRRFTAPERRALEASARRYERFLSLPVAVTIA